jgi:hypothetical protein
MTTVLIMLHKISFAFSTKAMLTILGLVIAFHILVLAQIIPFDIVWGGRLQNASEMRCFEGVSILVNVLLILVIIIKGKYVQLAVSRKLINGILWMFVLLFALNTIGNLFSKATIETLIFTPVTLISAILCYRIAREKKE